MSFEFGAVLVVALLVLWRLCRCAHAWELVDKTEFPSRLEEMVKHCGHHPLFSDALTQSAQKKVILVIRCSKCGAAKVIEGGN